MCEQVRFKNNIAWRRQTRSCRTWHAHTLASAALNMCKLTGVLLCDGCLSCCQQSTPAAVCYVCFCLSPPGSAKLGTVIPSNLNHVTRPCYCHLCR
jgi:hypothetical protein